jgi:anti-sigma factor RsiW
LSVEENAELQKHLAGNPELQLDWDEDASLTTALNRLPNVPVSSNFISRVMQSVQRAEAETVRVQSPWRSFWRYGWLPRFAVAIAMFCLGTFSFHEYQIAARAKLAAGVKEFAETAPIPQLDWLKNFDTIEQMSKVQVADNELMMARQ